MFNRSAKFTAVERAILESVSEVMPLEAKQRYLDQVSLIDKIQRLCDDKEVDFYIKRGWFGTRPFPDAVKFAYPVEEFKLAKVTVKSRDSGYSTKAHVWIVSGHVFSIEFGKSPKKLSSNFEITSVELLQNPMDSGSQN